MVLENPLSPRFRVTQKRRKKVARAKQTTETSALQLLVLTQFFPPDFAATGQLMEELVGQLGQQGVNVSVFTGQPSYAFSDGVAPSVERQGNVFVKRSRVSRLLSNRIRGKALNGVLYTLRSIAHLAFNRHRYQVLLVTTAPPFLSVIAYLANLFFKLPYVCLLYDLYPDIAVKLDVVKASHPVAQLWRRMNQKIWQRSAGIIVLSDSMKSSIIDHCPTVINKISVIHSWSDEQKIVPIKKEDNWFAKEHGLVDPFVVLYSGNMGRCHDIDTIFEAAYALKDEPILFVCIGGGVQRSPLQQKVTDNNLKNVRFLPYQKKSVLPYSLTASDVFLVSVADGMESLVAPSKLYPAMAAGRPIAAVCSPNSYLGPLLTTASCGTAFKNGKGYQLADYIRALSQDPDKVKALGAAGRQYLEAHFTPAIISGQYLKVMKSAATK